QGAPADIALAHPDHQGNHDGAFHQTLAMLCSARVMLVDVHRMQIHREQAKQRIVEFRDGASRPMPKGLADFDLMEISPVVHSALHVKLAASSVLPVPL